MSGRGKREDTVSVKNESKKRYQGPNLGRQSQGGSFPVFPVAGSSGNPESCTGGGVVDMAMQQHPLFGDGL